MKTILADSHIHATTVTSYNPHLPHTVLAYSHLQIQNVLCNGSVNINTILNGIQVGRLTVKG